MKAERNVPDDGDKDRGPRAEVYRLDKICHSISTPTRRLHSSSSRWRIGPGEAIRCAGQHGLVGGAAVLDGQPALLEGDAEIAAQFFHDLQADAVEDGVPRRRNDRAAADEEKVGGDRLGDEAVGV